MTRVDGYYEYVHQLVLVVSTCDVWVHGLDHVVTEIVFFELFYKKQGRDSSGQLL